MSKTVKGSPIIAAKAARPMKMLFEIEDGVMRIAYDCNHEELATAIAIIVEEYAVKVNLDSAALVSLIQDRAFMYHLGRIEIHHNPVLAMGEENPDPEELDGIARTSFYEYHTIDEPARILAEAANKARGAVKPKGSA